MFEHLLRGVDLASLPPPPSNGSEWRERVIEIERRVPELSSYVADAPVGWFAIIEHAARLISGLLEPGERFCTRQIKEKLGTLRWYSHVVLPSGDWDGRHAALGAVEWTEHVSETLCSLHGTPDGTLDTSQDWLLTLSPQAQQDRRELGTQFNRMLYPSWTHE